MPCSCPSHTAQLNSSHPSPVYLCKNTLFFWKKCKATDQTRQKQESCFDANKCCHFSQVIIAQYEIQISDTKDCHYNLWLQHCCSVGQNTLTNINLRFSLLLNIALNFVVVINIKSGMVKVLQKILTGHCSYLDFLAICDGIGPSILSIIARCSLFSWV